VTNEKIYQKEFFVHLAKLKKLRSKRMRSDNKKLFQEIISLRNKAFSKINLKADKQVNKFRKAFRLFHLEKPEEVNPMENLMAIGKKYLNKNIHYSAIRKRNPLHQRVT